MDPVLWLLHLVSTAITKTSRWLWGPSALDQALEAMMATPPPQHEDPIRWLPGHYPAKVRGDCPHDCRHETQTVVASGPDLKHYQLVECVVPGGCHGQCRGWLSLDPHNHGSEAWGWKQVRIREKTS